MNARAVLGVLRRSTRRGARATPVPGQPPAGLLPACASSVRPLASQRRLAAQAGKPASATGSGAR